MQIHETTTTLAPGEVIARARDFFSALRVPSAGTPERGGDTFLRLHLEVGEMVIGALAREGATLVRGSASRGAPLLTAFLTTLPPWTPAPPAPRPLARAA